MLAPAVNETESAVVATDASDAVLLIVETMGDPGTAAGVRLSAPVAVPLPAAFTALTRTEYAVPFVSPVMSNEVEVVAAEVQDVPSFVEYSYVLIGKPLLLGAVNETDSRWLAAVTLTLVGTDGAATG